MKDDFNTNEIEVLTAAYNILKKHKKMQLMPLLL